MYKNKEWLYSKYINEKLPTTKIGKMCGVSNGAIRYFCIKYNIPIRSKCERHHLAQINHSNLSPIPIEWINGELLGDGCLHSYSKYSAIFVYGSKHLEYIEYIRDTLKSYGIEQMGKIYKQIDKKQGNVSYHYSSRSYPELLTIYKHWYPKGKKVVPKDIVLTPLVCRQWYIGDGSLAHPKYSKNIILSTYGFYIKDVKWLTKQLNKVRIKANRQKKNAIHISANSVKNFLEYIGECPTKCYQYKWAI